MDVSAPEVIQPAAAPIHDQRRSREVGPPTNLCDTEKNQDPKSYSHHESNEETNNYQDANAKKQRDEEDVGGSAQAGEQTEKRETQLEESVEVQDRDSGKQRPAEAEVSHRHEKHNVKKQDEMSDTRRQKGIKMNSGRNTCPPVKYHGLLNQGATCYLNSVLQVLFMTKDFREAVERDVKENPDHDCIDRHLSSLFADLKEREAYTYKIIQKLGITRVYDKQDAAEYFKKILSLTSPGASQIFHGQLTYKTICTRCSAETDTDETFWHLPLPLDSNSDYYQCYSVVHGIEDYFRSSEFRENQIYCNECHAKSDATIKRVIKHHPDVLMLLLKRFEFNKISYMTYVKNYRPVVVPFTLQIPENQTYELYAVVDHFGNLRSGHYTATIKDDEGWYRFDDGRVTLNHDQPFQKDNTEKSYDAYLLFYRKKNVPAADTQDDMDVSAPEVIQPAAAPIHDQRRSREVGPPTNLCDTEKNQDPKSYSHHESNEETNNYQDANAKKQRDEEDVGGSAQAGEQAGKRETQLEESVEVQERDSGKQRPAEAEVSHRHEKHYVRKQDEMSDTRRQKGIKMNSGRNTCPPVKYHGLLNQGATCYLNSVLQVLFMTEDFREAVERDVNENPDHDCIDRHLSSLFADLKEWPAYTYKITRKLGITRVYEQQDAAEYFEKILTLTRSGASQIFHGELTHKTICTRCSSPTDRDGTFWHLPLALEDSNSEFKVVDGIKDYFRPSEFSGDNQIYCNECHAKSDATIKRVIKHHPDVLMLLLKRFEFKYSYMTYVKNYRPVVVPFTLQIPENQTYELYAVVDHFGSLRSGHYTATIKDDERWYTFNDSRVTLLDYQPFQVDDFAKFCDAYLLFYRKKNVPAADTQDNREVSTPGGIPSATTPTCDQCQDAGKMRKNAEEVEEEGNETADVYIKRNKETEIKRRSSNMSQQCEDKESKETPRSRGGIKDNSKTKTD